MKNQYWRLTIRVAAVVAAVMCSGMWMPEAVRAQERVGEVAFENSGATGGQRDFLHGLAQLHNFEFEFAAEDFQRAEKSDPGFAMAYWGEAMTFNHPLWAEQDADAGRAALKKLGATPEERIARAKTEREKAYLQAVEALYGEGTKFERDSKYADAMKLVHEKYPADIDGTCFYALALLGTAHNGRDIPTYMRAAGLMEDIFYAHPNHPGAAHYLIHSFDDPVHAPLGLPAARAYSKIAPDAGHAQHMTSHIFLALGMWDDVIRANVNATNVVNAQREAAGKPTIFCGHYNNWLAYAYLQTGRFAGAKQLTAGCRKQAENAPSSEHQHRGGGAAGSFVEMRAQYVIGAKEWSGEAVEWNAPGDLSSEEEFEQSYVTAYAAAMRGDDAAAKGQIAKMEEIAPKLPTEFEKAGYGHEEWTKIVPEIEAAQIHVLQLANERKLEEAIELAKKTAKQEEALPYAFGPPVVPKPSLELLGELQMKGGHAAEARGTFVASLARTPGRTQSLEGLLAAQVATGDKDGAAQTSERLKENRKQADGGTMAARE